MSAAVGRIRRVSVIDATLREGAQTAGVTFGREQSEEIAHLLVASGVDMIECGHPSASDEERRRVAAVGMVADGVPVLAHARAVKADIDAVLTTDVQWVGIFIGINEYSMRTRVRVPLETSLAMIAESVGYAINHGLCVRLTVEDASRTRRDDLVRAYRVAVEAGARRIGFADTVGILEPSEVRSAADWLRGSFDDIDIEFHLHNDRGLSIANALAAIDSTDCWISCAINGLGERAGITDVFGLLANLEYRELRRIRNPAALKRASQLVQAFSRVAVDPLRPVIGSNAFTHTASLHRKAVALDEMAYSWIAPERLGFDSQLASNSSWDRKELIVAPEIRSSSELPHHRHGPGTRYVLLDNSRLTGCGQYCIARHVGSDDVLGLGHVDTHRHSVDSLFVFLGERDDLTGLTAEVDLEGELFGVESPAAVFIPAGMRHFYRFKGGSGIFLNHVLAGNYKESLLE